MPRKLFIAITTVMGGVLFLWRAGLTQDTDPFPEPEGLKPAMAFWEKVYLEVTSRQGFLHDGDGEMTVYATLDLPNLSPRAQSRWLKEERRKIKDKIAQCSKAETGELCERLPKTWKPADYRRAMGDIRFQLGQKDRFLAGHIRSGRYIEHMKRILKEEGVPEDLAYLPHVESSFDYNAYSKVGAAGIWQFMRSTGRNFMKIDYIMDERRDPLVATRSAARYMKRNYQILGSWPLTVTGYNHGSYGIKRITKKLGTNDIDVIVQRYRSRSFGFASRNFYAQFLVTRNISKQAQKYLGEVTVEPTAQFTTYTIPKYLPAKKVAEALSLSLDDLQHYNPSLRPPVWRGYKLIPKGYSLRVPGSEDATTKLASLVGSSASTSQQLSSDWHRVSPGETLTHVARRYQVPLERLMEANDLTLRSRVLVGQVLQIPGTAPEAAPKGPTPPQVIAALGPQAPAETGGVTQVTLPIAHATPTPPDVVNAEVTATASGEETAQEDQELEASPAAPSAEPPQMRDMSMRLRGLAVISEKAVGKKRVVQIRIESDESLSNFSEWSQARMQSILSQNSTPTRKSPKARDIIQVGRTLWVPLASSVSTQQFESARLEFHKASEEDFFLKYMVVDIKGYTVRKRDVLWGIAQRFEVPMWLIQRLNPDIEFSVLPGKKMNIPVTRPRQT